MALGIHLVDLRWYWHARRDHCSPSRALSASSSGLRSADVPLSTSLSTAAVAQLLDRRGRPVQKSDRLRRGHQMPMGSDGAMAPIEKRMPPSLETITNIGFCETVGHRRRTKAQLQIRSLASRANVNYVEIGGRFFTQALASRSETRRSWAIILFVVILRS